MQIRKYIASLFFLCLLASEVFSAADMGNTTVISPTDASNASGTCPSWSGSAAPSTLDDSARCLQGALAREWEARSFVTSTGTAPAFVVTQTVAPAAYRTGQSYCFTAHAAAVGTDTANFNSLGAKAIKKIVAGVKTATAANDFYTNDKVCGAYDGTDLVWWNRGSELSNYAPLASANTFTANQTITSTDAGASADPKVILHRNSASPAASDVIGQKRFDGEDDASNQQEYAAIEAAIADPTDASEDGALDLYAHIAGTRTRYLGVGRNAAGTATANSLGLPLGQLSFPATQNSSSDVNTLDDYEEGTWTPTFSAGGSSTGVTYSNQAGHYIKIGKMVWAYGLVVLTNNGTGSGTARIEGLPFNPAIDAPGTVFLNTGGSAATGINVLSESGTDNLYIILQGATGFAFATETNCTNTFNFSFLIMYVI